MLSRTISQLPDLKWDICLLNRINGIQKLFNHKWTAREQVAISTFEKPKKWMLPRNSG